MVQYLPMLMQIVATGRSLYDMFARPKQPQAPPALSYNEALGRAEDALNPVYDRHLRDTLNQVDNANIARGFYGQLPGDVLARSTAADVQGQRASQIANLAQQMTAQSEAQALAQQQLAMQWAAQQQATRQQGLGSFMNIAGNMMGQQNWQKEFDENRRRWEKMFPLQETAITGVYKGEPTRAAKQGALNLINFSDLPNFPAPRQVGIPENLPGWFNTLRDKAAPRDWTNVWG